MSMCKRGEPYPLVKLNYTIECDCYFFSGFFLAAVSLTNEAFGEDCPFTVFPTVIQPLDPAAIRGEAGLVVKRLLGAFESPTVSLSCPAPGTIRPPSKPTGVVVSLFSSLFLAFDLCSGACGGEAERQKGL